ASGSAASHPDPGTSGMVEISEESPFFLRVAGWLSASGSRDSDAARQDHSEPRAPSPGSPVPDQLQPQGAPRSYPGPGRDRRRGGRLGRVRQPRRSVLLSRDDGDVLAYPPRFSGPDGPG